MPRSRALVRPLSAPAARTCGLELGPNHSRGSRQRCQLAERLLTRQVLHAAVGCEDEAFRLDMPQRVADALDDRVHILDRAVVGEVDDAYDQLLVLEVAEHGEVDVLLRGLDRDLLRGRL